MDKASIHEAIEKLKAEKKRKFSQSYDLIINLRGVDIKTNPLDFFLTLPFPKAKKPKIAAFVAQELGEQAEKFCDLVLREADFEKYDSKAQKKLAQSYDYFISQSNLMPKVAQVFGKSLGTKGKMPNPKIGCVVPPNANLEPLVKRLQSSIKLSAKKSTNLQCFVGKEGMPDEQVIENILSVYSSVIKQLPLDQQNIKGVCLKLTMSKPVII